MDRRPSSSLLTVLVAIAKPAVSHLVVGLLREFGLKEAITVDSAEFARLQLRHAGQKFDLVVCDRLGDGEHLALLKFIRWECDRVLPSLPVICIGNAWIGEELMANRDAGATATLALPITKHAIKVAVENALSDRREFVMGATFRGVNRRVALVIGYKGPFRRSTDTNFSVSDHSSTVSQDCDGSITVRDIQLAEDNGSDQAPYNNLSWSKSIETGNEDIDSEHYCIINILNDLNNIDLSVSDEAEAVERALSALKEYIKTHFSNEERLMDSFDYDDRQRHKSLHAAFAAKIEKISTNNIAAANTRRKLLVSIYDWLISHITGVDRVMIAKLKGEFCGVHNDTYETQTALVIDDALEIVRHIHQMLILLTGASSEQKKSGLYKRVAEATERLVNLMELACTRIEVCGCSNFHIRQLGDIRAAVNTNADNLAGGSVRNLITYGRSIISGKHGVPLGVGSVLTQKTVRIESLVHVIGGAHALSQPTRAAVCEAMEIASAVHTLEAKASAGLMECHLFPEPGFPITND